MYYKGALGALLIYDVTNDNSFNSISNWYNDLIQNCEKNISIILIGNKSDLEHQRHISIEQGKNKAHELNIAFIETSAKTNSNLNEAVNLLFKMMCEAKANRLETDEEVYLKDISLSRCETISEEENKKCC